MRKRILQLLLGAAFSLSLSAQTAHSADITVDGNACTLDEAITSANNDNAAGNGCVNGSGDDTITLQADVTLAAALPQISSTITIEAAGHRIDGQNNAAVGSVLRVGSTGNLTLSNAVVTGGNTTSEGGGIYNNGALTLHSCAVSGNRAGYQGGGIDNINGTLTLNNSAITANATQFGGGIHNFSGAATVNNSTVSGNIASSMGGGIYADAISVVILNSSTVSGNTAANFGGGLLANNAMITLHAALISGNSAATGSELYSHESAVSGSFNLFGHSGETSAQAFFGFTPGASNIIAASDGTTPTALADILSPLASNGGPTQTHALVAGSPAIDLDSGACDTGLSTDQRGHSRPAGSGCDAGAYEYVALPNRVNMAPVYKLLLLKRR